MSKVIKDKALSEAMGLMKQLSRRPVFTPDDDDGDEPSSDEEITSRKRKKKGGVNKKAAAKRGGEMEESSKVGENVATKAAAGGAAARKGGIELNSDDEDDETISRQALLNLARARAKDKTAMEIDLMLRQVTSAKEDMSKEVEIRDEDLVESLPTQSLGRGASRQHAAGRAQAAPSTSNQNQESSAPGKKIVFTVQMKDVPAGTPMRISENDPMSKVFDAFCQRNGLNPSKVKFKWDGAVVKRDQLAKSLDADDEPHENQLDAIAEPGSQAYVAPSASNQGAAPGKRLVFTVQMKDVPPGAAMRISENDPMGKVFDAFCQRNGLNPSKVKFKWDGAVVKRDQLAKSLDADDEPHENQLDAIAEPGSQAYVAPSASNQGAAPGKRLVFTVQMKDVPPGAAMRISENDPMGKIFDAFCKRHNLNSACVKFKWDGAVVKRDQLAKSLDADDEPHKNQLDAIAEPGSFQGASAAASNQGSATSPGTAAGKRFVFTVQMKDVPPGAPMRISENDPMGKIFDAFCNRHGFAPSKVKFKWDGVVVKRDRLAKSLDADDEPHANQLDAVKA